jgi:hypothetical protein
VRTYGGGVVCSLRGGKFLSIPHPDLVAVAIAAMHRRASHDGYCPAPGPRSCGGQTIRWRAPAPGPRSCSGGARSHRGPRAVPGQEPSTCFAPPGRKHGRPSTSKLPVCLLPCPVALISRGAGPASWSRAAVLLPPQAASIQRAPGKLLSVRWYFVKPSEPHSKRTLLFQPGEVGKRNGGAAPPGPAIGMGVRRTKNMIEFSWAQRKAQNREGRSKAHARCHFPWHIRRRTNR